MAQQWFVDYEREVLESLINKKRLERGVYDFIKEDKLRNLISKTMREQKLDKLDTLKYLINKVRIEELKI
ncbi:MAG: hypothetical protein RR342_01270 [Bacilli bacterium]|jgi:hypothetical protein